MALVKKGEESNIEREVIIDENIEAPLEAGEKIGTVKFTRDGELLAQVDLNTDAAVEKKGIVFIITDFFRTIFNGNETKNAEIM